MLLRIFVLIFIFLKIAQTYADEIPVIVIAPSKSPQSYATVGSSVSIIDSEELKESDHFFLGDVLDENLVGMNYFRSGGHGTSTGIQLRGLPKRYSTVYIDGVKMSDPSSSDNSFYFSNVMNGAVNRVEVLKGSQSTIYGGSAIGGAINIYTKKATKKKNKEINVFKGNNGTENLNISYEDYNDNYNYFISLNKFYTKGISAMNDGLSSNDKDEYENEGIITNYSYNLGKNLSFNGGLRYSVSFLEYDEVKAGRTDENNNTTDTELSYNLRLTQNSGKFISSLIYNKTDIERATKTYTNASKNYYGYRDTINFIGEYNFDLDTKIIYGLDNEFDQAKFQKDGSTDYLSSDEAIYSQYFDLQLRSFEKFYSTVGFRRDDHTTAGNYYTGRLTIAYQLDGSSKLRASYGTGVRFPALYDYFYGTVVKYKEDLEAEKSRSFDVGYETKFEKINTDFNISVFKITYDNALEDWKSHAWTVKNSEAKVKSEGIEISSLWKPIDNFNIGLNYNYNDTYDGADCDNPDKGSTECIDSAMVRVPRHSLTTSINFKTNYNLKNKILIKYSGETRDYGNTNNGFADVILDDYIVMDYLADYNLYDQYKIYFSAKNIFDQNYEQAYQYSTLGRTFNIGLKTEF